MTSSAIDGSCVCAIDMQSYKSNLEMDEVIQINLELMLAIAQNYRWANTTNLASFVLYKERA